MIRIVLSFWDTEAQYARMPRTFRCNAATSACRTCKCSTPCLRRRAWLQVAGAAVPLRQLTPSTRMNPVEERRSRPGVRTVAARADCAPQAGGAVAGQHHRGASRWDGGAKKNVPTIGRSRGGWNKLHMVARMPDGRDLLALPRTGTSAGGAHAAPPRSPARQPGAGDGPRLRGRRDTTTGVDRLHTCGSAAQDPASLGCTTATSGATRSSVCSGGLRASGASSHVRETRTSMMQCDSVNHHLNLKFAT